MRKLLKFIEEKFLFWATAFLIFFIPIYPKFPLFPVVGTYVHIRLEDIFVAITLFVFFVWVIFAKKYDFLKWPLSRYLCLFFATGFLSVLSALWITKNIIPHITFLHFLRRVEYISLLFIAYFSFKEKRKLHIFSFVFFLSTFLVAIYGLGQKFWGWPVISTMNKEFSKGQILKLTWWARVNSTFAGHYDLAAYLVIFLSLLVGFLIITKNKVLKILLSLLGILAFYLLLMTSSRISFVAYLVAICFILFFASKKIWIAPFLIFSILGMIFSSDLGQRYAATFKINISFLSSEIKPKGSQLVLMPTFTPTPVPTLIPTPTLIPSLPVFKPSQIILTPTPAATVSAEPEWPEPEATAMAVTRSTDIRLKAEWPRALRAFAKNPLLGTGYSSITLATDNDYLRMLGETGILGFLTFFLFILEILRKFIVFLKTSNQQNEKIIIISILGAMIGFFLNAAFIDVLEASKIAFIFWIMIGIGLKIVEIGAYEKNQNK